MALKKFHLKLLLVSCLISSCGVQTVPKGSGGNIQKASAADAFANVQVRGERLPDIENYTDLVPSDGGETVDGEDASQSMRAFLQSIGGLPNFETWYASQDETTLAASLSDYNIVYVASKGGGISAQDIKSCDKYFPGSDRNRWQFLSNASGTMFVYIDGSGRPKSALKTRCEIGLAWGRFGLCCASRR